jgi:hypothetical protein
MYTYFFGPEELFSGLLLAVFYINENPFYGKMQV